MNKYTEEDVQELMGILGEDSEAEIRLGLSRIKRLPKGPMPNDTPLSRARLAAGLSQKEAAALAKKWLGKGSTRRWVIWEKPGAKFPPILIQLLNDLKK